MEKPYHSNVQMASNQISNDQENLGAFSYDSKGFFLKEPENITQYNWSDITTIIGFKLDLMTTDEVAMDIFFSDNNVIRLTESIAGWTQFIKKLSEQFSTISQNWDGDILMHPFATNMTLLFDRLGRSREQAVACCYPEKHGR